MKVKLVIAAAAVTLFCGAAVTWSHLRHASEPKAERADEEGAKAAENGEGRLITIPDEKWGALDIRVAPAAMRPLQEFHVVPARLQYDATKHVDIRAAANGTLIDLRASVGDRVAAGQVLGVLSSPEIGLARTEVHHSHERWELAAKKQEWEREISGNVFGLIDALKSHLPADELEKRFRGRTLGKSRDVLMSAYSRFLLARNLTKSAEGSGSALPTMAVEQRMAERRSAEAALVAATEQAAFDVVQERRKAEIEAGDALRQLHIAQERLTTLLGYSPDNVPENATAGDVLSRVEIRAPFAGTIEEKHFAQSERVRTADTILVLADTKNLWVAADIREQDWRALAIAPGQELAVDTPALPGRRFVGRLRHIGRQVMPETNSVPLVAELSNADGLLRPGLFAHVTIPVGPARVVLCVPAKSIVQNDGAELVFAQEGAQAFRPVKVTTGLRTDDQVEVVRGLQAGTPIAVEGVMALKSEMLVESLLKED